MRASTVNSKRCASFIPNPRSSRTTIMRSNWCRTGIGASILPSLYPGIIALNIFKRSIFCKREYIVKLARTFRNDISAC